MSARLLRISAALLVAVTVGLAAPPAEAQTRGQIRRARILFARGLHQFDRHRYQAALRTFTRAYQLAPAPPLVYNMAQCHAALGNDARAAESYRLFLQLAPDAPNRAEVERRLRQIDAHLLAERRRQQRQVVREVTAEQERIADQERVEDEQEDESRGGSVGLVTWITLGTGVLTAGVGALFHLDAVAQQDALDDPQLDCHRAIGRCLDIVEAGDRSAMLRTILLSAGGAILTTGVIMLILDLGSEDEPNEPPLSVSPSLGRQYAGLQLGGTW